MLQLRGLSGYTFKQLSAELQPLYNGCGHDHAVKLAADDSDPIMKIAEALTRQVWNTKEMPDTINKRMVRAFAEEYIKALGEGYSAIDYSTADSKLYGRLVNDVYQFSAAKNYSQLKSLSEALMNEQGKLRSFSEFKVAAFEINDKHINQWLKTEYDTAVAGAQMGGKWEQIQEDKEILPLLSFDAVMDDRTSELCGGFDGVTKPVDDDFWKRYYPPNHFNCRSTVRQLSEGKETPNNKISIPEIPAMFRTNLAEKGLAFPDGHPYYKGLPDSVRAAADKMTPKDEQ